MRISELRNLSLFFWGDRRICLSSKLVKTYAHRCNTFENNADGRWIMYDIDDDDDGDDDGN